MKRSSYTFVAIIGTALSIGMLLGCASSAPSTRNTPSGSPERTIAAAAPSAPSQLPPTAPPLPPIMPFDEALLFAANTLFSKAELPPGGTFPLVIDPLIDGDTGFQSVATQTMQTRITDLVAKTYPQFALQPFTTSILAQGPLLFIGTFTPVDKNGKNIADREWFRICLALVDLRSGKIVSKGYARAHPQGIDNTPTAFFLESPAWVPDPVTQGYAQTCQSAKVGDSIHPQYWDRLIASALINDAIMAYNEGRYEDALDLYQGLLHTAGGQQLRVFNGLYLTNWLLGRRTEATQAFAQLVDFGLAQNQLAIKFLFRPGSTLFVSDPQLSGPYHMWLTQIAQRTAQRTACMEISGHTSRTGLEPVNDRLSLMRAQYVKQRLETNTPPLRKQLTAVGKGARENISGLGTDDARDALDRRVEFKVKDC